MKVALCTPSLSRVGGSQAFMSHLAIQLRELGHEVSMWTLGQTTGSQVFCIKRTAERLPVQHTMKLGIDVIPWQELHEHHDVVHITNAGQVYLGFEELLDKNLGPTVLTVHDPHEMLVNQREGRFLRLCEVADRVHFIGRNYFDHFRACHYIDIDRKGFWARQPYSPLTPLGEVPSHSITCTSNWRWNKNIPLIVRAAELMANAEANEYPELDLQFWTTDRMADVEHQVQTLKGWDYCSVHGDGLDPTEFIYAAYAARVLLCMTVFDEYDTGRTEYPVLEAWNFGVTPVLNADFVGGNPSDYTIGKEVYSAPPTPEAVAAHCLAAIRMPLDKLDMAKRLVEHGIEQSGAVIARVYEELVAA